MPVLAENETQTRTARARTRHAIACSSRRLDRVSLGFWLGAATFGTGGAILGACMPYHHAVSIAISMIWWGIYIGSLGASLGALVGLFTQCAPSSGRTTAVDHPYLRNPGASVINRDRNTFAEKSESYVRARPRYPAGLFRWIYGQCQEHGSAWDCATGNGQAAFSLATYFVRVDATDHSAEQIAHALPHPRVRYSVASAEASGLPDAEYDLVTVAQALHWFHFERFWREVRRVTRPNAFFCAWGYDWPETTPAVDQTLIAPFRALLEPYWASNNRIVWNGYRTEEVGFPFARVSAPCFAIEAGWTLDQLVDYLMTRSAFKRSGGDARARQAIDELLRRARSFIPADEVIQIRMPLKVLAGRVR